MRSNSQTSTLLRLLLYVSVCVASSGYAPLVRMVTESTVTIDWDEPPFTTVSDVLYMYEAVGHGRTIPWTVAATVVNGTTAVVEGLKTGLEYQLQLRSNKLYSDVVAVTPVGVYQAAKLAQADTVF